MNPEQYQHFTQRLHDNLAADSRVLGLVALGSMADKSHHPDKFSDHDFFVIVPTGLQSNFRQNLAWLPAADQIVFSYQETEHGLKVLYQSGHLLEFAVFDETELGLARINDYAVLLDRTTITQRLAELADRTTHDIKPDDHYDMGQLLAHLLVGAGRAARGETISGHAFIKMYALTDLLKLFTRHLEASTQAVLDNLDPLRRFEVVYPELGAEVNAVLLLEPISAAQAMLALADKWLKNRLANYPATAVATVQRFLESIS